MNEVVIAGIGQIPVGEHWERSLRAIANDAIQLALADAGALRPQLLYVGNTLSPNLSHQANLGALLADFSGLVGLESVSFEAGGASGAAALRQGFLAIASGMVEVALVIGVEKVTDVIGTDVETALATSLDSEYETVHGLTPTSQAALLAQRYQHEFDLPPDGLAGFPLVAHANAAGNKNALYRKAISLETYQKAEPVCQPLNLFDIAPLADGAAAVLLTRRDLLPTRFLHPVVRISASASFSDTLSLHSRLEMLDFQAARLSVDAVLKKTGIHREQIDLFEYSDVYSIYAPLSLEAAGFARRGQGWKMGIDDSIALTGQIPCATQGGLKARGNPLGATGVYQAVEAVLQLRGQAGPGQVTGAKCALIQNLSGPASLAITHLLEQVG